MSFPALLISKSVFYCTCAAWMFSIAAFSQSDLDAKLPPATEDLVKSFNDHLEKQNNSNVRVGVLEFENSNEQSSELGLFLCNELTTWLSLYASDKFTVIVRQDVEKIIQEKEASTKYRTGKDKLEVLKKYKIVDYVLVGTITQFSEEYRINVRILSTDNANTGSVAAVKIIHLNRSSDLDKMFSAKVASNESNSSGSHDDKGIKEDPKSIGIGNIVDGVLSGTPLCDFNKGLCTATVRIDGIIYKVHSIPGLSGQYMGLLSYEKTVITFEIDGDKIGKYLSHRAENK